MSPQFYARLFGTAFFLLGAAAIVWFTRRTGRTFGLALAATPALLALVTAAWTVLGLVAGRSGMVARFFRPDRARVRAARLEPSRAAYGGTLVTSMVRVTDPASIDELLAALSQAEPCTTSHPTVTWNALLGLEDDRGLVYGSVMLTRQRGAVVTMYSGGFDGWILGERCAPALGPVLERLSRGQDTIK